MNTQNVNLKTAIKAVIKGVCFLVGFLVIFCFCQRLLQGKWIEDGAENTASTSTWLEYRALEPDTVDVLFLGTSHVYSGIDPMYMYEQSGITAYALGGPGMRFDLTYLSLKEALKTQTPKLVLLDMSAVQYAGQQTEAKCQKVADQFPLSLEKLEYALNPDSDEIKALNILFPLFRYHTRWENLGENDFRYAAGSLDETVVRGHYLNYDRVETAFHFYEDAGPESECHIEGRNLEYLKQIESLCREKDIQLIFYKLPSPTWYQAQSEGSAAIAEEFDVPFLELFYRVGEIGIDPAADFRDLNNHLNQEGAEKVSAYLARYLQEQYGLEDRRGKNAEWDGDLVKYREKKESVKAAAGASRPAG